MGSEAISKLVDRAIGPHELANLIEQMATSSQQRAITRHLQAKADADEAQAFWEHLKEIKAPHGDLSKAIKTAIQARYLSLRTRIEVDIAPVVWRSMAGFLDEMCRDWLRYVRPATFVGWELGRFRQTWELFYISVYYPQALESKDPDTAQEVFEQASRAVFDTESTITHEFLNGLSGVLSSGLEPSDGNDPLAFEQRCAALLREAGWSASTTKGSGDQGVDVIATKGDIRVVIQCKLYAGLVGNKAVQEIVGGRGYERAHAGAVVANAGFTRSAQALAAMNGIALIHDSELSDWAAKVEASMSSMSVASEEDAGQGVSEGFNKSDA